MKKLAVLLILFYGCSPKIIVKNYTANNSYAKVEAYESFALIEENGFEKSGNEKLVANIVIKDNGLSLNCDYETIKRLGEEKARELGGNCLLITEHKEPNMISTCHSIKGQVWIIENPEKYEKHILWHPKRHLKIENFRGDTIKRPFQAATYTMMSYYATINPINGKAKVTVENLFNCNLSYFKNSEYDSLVLSHEQLHFDITEIYTRRLRKRIKQTSSYKEFLQKHETIFSEIQEKMHLKQDEYDAEVYKNRSLQTKWNSWVTKELNDLKEFSEREIVWK